MCVVWLYHLLGGELPVCCLWPHPPNIRVAERVSSNPTPTTTNTHPKALPRKKCNCAFLPPPLMQLGEGCSDALEAEGALMHTHQEFDWLDGEIWKEDVSPNKDKDIQGLIGRTEKCEKKMCHLTIVICIHTTASHLHDFYLYWLRSSWTFDNWQQINDSLLLGWDHFEIGVSSLPSKWVTMSSKVAWIHGWWRKWFKDIALISFSDCSPAPYLTVYTLEKYNLQQLTGY